MESDLLFNLQNYYTAAASFFGLSAFMIFGFLVEKAAAIDAIPRIIIRLTIYAYLVAMLIYPIVLIQWIQSQPLSAVYFVMFIVAWNLKLISFHHVMWDNRALLRRVSYERPELFLKDCNRRVDPEKLARLSKDDLVKLSSKFNVNADTFEMAMEYPKYLNARHFLRFVVAPTCCY